MARTTQKQFRCFQKYCKYYIDKFGLKNWKVAYKLKNIGECFSDVSWIIPGNAASIFLTDQDNCELAPLTEEELKRTAKHAILCLVLARLRNCMDKRFLSEEDGVEAGQEVLRMLENIVQ